MASITFNPGGISLNKFQMIDSVPYGLYEGLAIDNAFYTILDGVPVTFLLTEPYTGKRNCRCQVSGDSRLLATIINLGSPDEQLQIL